MKVLIVILMLALPVGIGVGGATAAEVGGEPGSIEGQVADSTRSPLPGARVEIEPRGLRLATDRQGRFTASSLPPGEYRVRISYLGFTDYEGVVKVEAGGRTSLHVELTPHVSEEVTVTAPRARGGDAALNQQKSAENIVNAPPAEVIRSLPNTNVADAIGRLPSVSLERDEGEGKYVQVRGLEPRYTNAAINGAHIPSSESGGRQLKLDAIPSDLVGAIELHKTLSADQDGDAIGGSINFVTKSAGDRQSFTVGAQGGYTDPQDRHSVYQFDGTYSNRFGTGKKLGLVLGGTYDWNGRGIDDIEPGVDTVELPDGRSTAAFTGIDYRLY